MESDREGTYALPEGEGHKVLRARIRAVDRLAPYDDGPEALTFAESMAELGKAMSKMMEAVYGAHISTGRVLSGLRPEHVVVDEITEFDIAEERSPALNLPPMSASTHDVPASLDIRYSPGVQEFIEKHTR